MDHVTSQFLLQLDQPQGRFSPRGSSSRWQVPPVVRLTAGAKAPEVPFVCNDKKASHFRNRTALMEVYQHFLDVPQHMRNCREDRDNTHHHRSHGVQNKDEWNRINRKKQIQLVPTCSDVSVQKKTVAEIS